jgi:hypothetical protein
MGERRERGDGLKGEKHHFFDSDYLNVRVLFQMVAYNDGSLALVFFTFKVPKTIGYDI